MRTASPIGARFSANGKSAGSETGRLIGTAPESWYVSAAYRFNKWLEVGGYYTEYYEDVTHLRDPLNFQKDAALKEASGMDASQFKTFWQRLAFSGRGQLPQNVRDADSLVALVATTKGAIAIVPADAALNGVKKIAIQ